MPHAIPGIAHRFLHVLPGAVATVLEAVPTRPQIALDVIPFAPAIPVGCLVPVLVPGTIIVVSTVRAYVRPRAPAVPPVLILGRPVDVPAGSRGAGGEIVAFGHHASS